MMLLIYCRTGNFHGHVIFTVGIQSTKINHCDLDRVKKKIGKNCKKPEVWLQCFNILTKGVYQLTSNSSLEIGNTYMSVKLYNFWYSPHLHPWKLKSAEWQNQQTANITCPRKLPVLQYPIIWSIYYIENYIEGNCFFHQIQILLFLLILPINFDSLAIHCILHIKLYTLVFMICWEDDI